MHVRAIPPITVTLQIHFHPDAPNGKNPRPYPREATAPRLKNGPVKRQWTRPQREALSKHSAPMTPRDAVHKTVLQTGDTAQPRANANHGRHQKRKPLTPLHNRSRCEPPGRSAFLMLSNGLTFALTCDGAFPLRARRRQVQRVVRPRALPLGGPPWARRTPAARPVLHRQE